MIVRCKLDNDSVGKLKGLTIDKICDGCDERSKCASIRTLGDGVSILCQDCIEGILESLDSSAVRDIKINKVLNDN